MEVENELGGGGWSWVHGLVIPDFLYKTVAANIDKDTLTDYIPLPQLITVNVLVKKMTPNGYDSFYLSNFGQKDKPYPRNQVRYKQMMILFKH